MTLEYRCREEMMMSRFRVVDEKEMNDKGVVKVLFTGTHTECCDYMKKSKVPCDLINEAGRLASYVLGEYDDNSFKQSLSEDEMRELY
jgi:hypothetical protein